MTQPLRSTPSTSVAVTQFLDHCRFAKCLSDNTLVAYRLDLADFIAYVGTRKSVSAIRRDHVRDYARELLERRALKEATVKRRIATLRVLFRWMEREELLSLTPFHRLEIPIRVPKRLPRALDAGEMRDLLERSEAETRQGGQPSRYVAGLMHFIIVTLFTTGLRIGELVSVRLDDINAPDGTIRVRGKGNRERHVFLPGSKALATLTRYLRLRQHLRPRHDQLLTAEDGSPMTTHRIRKSLSSLAKRAGLPRRLTPHMLRHTAATQLLEAGVDIRVVQRLLGHSSIATTQIYTQVTDPMLRERLTSANTLDRLQRQGR